MNIGVKVVQFREKLDLKSMSKKTYLLDAILRDLVDFATPFLWSHRHLFGSFFDVLRDFCKFRKRIDNVSILVFKRPVLTFVLSLPRTKNDAICKDLLDFGTPF
jgi:hypothetical protein